SAFVGNCNVHWLANFPGFLLRRADNAASVFLFHCRPESSLDVRQMSRHPSSPVRYSASSFPELGLRGVFGAANRYATNQRLGNSESKSKVIDSAGSPGSLAEISTTSIRNFLRILAKGSG